MNRNSLDNTQEVTGCFVPSSRYGNCRWNWCVLIYSWPFDRFSLHIASLWGYSQGWTPYFPFLSEMQFRGYQQWLEMVKRGRRKTVCLEDNGFSFILVKSELFVAYPWVYVICTWWQVTCEACVVCERLMVPEWFTSIPESGALYKINSTGPSSEPRGTPNTRGEETEA